MTDCGICELPPLCRGRPHQRRLEGLVVAAQEGLGNLARAPATVVFLFGLFGRALVTVDRPLEGRIL
jgi:hypothetical protein